MADRKLSNLDKDLKRALDKTLRQTVIDIESTLQSSKVSPTDTGRFRSNWMVGAGNANRATSEATTPTERAPSLSITIDEEYWISNNLDYAEKLAVEGRTVNKSPTWFTDFRNVTISKIVKDAVRMVKAEEGL